MRSQHYIRAATTAVLLLGALQLAAAHGEEEEHSGMGMGTNMNMNMNMSMGHNNSTSNGTEHEMIPVWDDFQPSYFRHGEYSGWMLIHILTMIAGWVIVMPAAIMLSVARSRYHLPAQVVFHVINGLGVFAGFVYNHATPDLYVVNAHHIMGWVLHAMAITWTLLSFCSAFNDWQKKDSPSSADRPLLSPHQPDFNQLHRYADRSPVNRWSQDSGMFSASRASSSDSVTKKQESQPLSPGASDDAPLDDYEQESEHEKRGFLGNEKMDEMLSRHAQLLSNSFVSKTIRFSQIVTEKFLLLLGFATLASGFVTYGGIFRGGEVFSGLAHYIKGAIFFWYGLLTLGRWMGAFAEFGWAWNIRPQQPLVAKWKTYIPSAEFTESFVIWLYGASNVFLERLGSQSDEWTPQEFEHISITVLFFGGGLLGMLIENKWLRSLMSTQVELQKSENMPLSAGASRLATINEAGVDEPEEWMQLKTENTSMNPMPALTIMLLGMMMSSHHQLSMVSTMMHKSWGTLFSGFAMARLVTYVLMYLKPPTSYYASRPPSELVAAFCLVSGGILFMNSAFDSVRSIETNGLDAMTVFTITMGLTGLIMAWEMICFGLKGWAVRKERAAAGRAMP
ncbi:hypothetical protein AMS68_006101 [Peltaster fructicola]|uniref:Protein YTP1-like C-terminal domain-containing protein n=1 Tax=Peltaster fructicola TaxID=286661 RepID=A0A6H0Y0Q4_9PEZI|nr:hypothetical protein AMS68_006101 [Peltaster fructicola]